MGFGKEGMRSKKKIRKLVRDPYAEINSKRGSAGAGFHSSDKYKREPKHKRIDYDD